MKREPIDGAPNLVLVETGGTRSCEIGRYPDLEAAKGAVRDRVGGEPAFSADPEYGGWRTRDGERTLRILEPSSAARLLEMADTPGSGGTTDLEMDARPASPEE